MDLMDAATDLQKNPYELLGGETGVRALCRAFYKAMDQLPEARTIREMHKESLVDVEQKLFEFLSGWLGGPHLYYKKYGTVCLSKPHRPYPIGEAERDQWLHCMDVALDKVEAPQKVRDMLRMPMKNMANMMRSH